MAKLILLLFAILAISPQSYGLTDVDRQGIYNKNLLDPYNGGFENGKSSWSITTDTFSIVTSGTNLLTGGASATWNSAGAGRIFKSKAVTIPNGLYGRNGVAQCLIQTPSGTATHTIDVYDGTNILATTTITSSTLPTPSGVNFIFPSTGTVQIRLTSVNADEPLIAIDDCYIGQALNISNVSQAEFFGSQKITAIANCYLAGTNSATYNNYSADSDCGTPTIVGNATSTAGKIPGISFASMPAGRYLVIANYSQDLSAAGLNCGARLSDGTNSAGAAYGTGTGAAGASPWDRQVVGTFSYSTAQGATTIQVQGATVGGSGTCDVALTITDFEIQVYHFPLAPEQAFRPDIGPSSWSGYHDSTCSSWSVTQSAYTADFSAEASCALVERNNRNFGTVTGSNTIPQIVFTPTRTGFYEICAYADWAGSNLAAVLSFKLWDGTTTIAERDVQVPVAGHGGTVPLCGLYNVTSIGSKTISIRGKASAGSVQITNLGGTSTIEWTVKAIDFSMNTPLLTQSVVGGTSGQSISREEWGDVYTTASGTVCSASPCASVTSNGVSSVTRTSTGIYVINFSPAFTVAPVCNFISTNAFRFFDQTGATTSAVTINSDTGTIAIPVAADSAFTFRCQGVR